MNVDPAAAGLVQCCGQCFVGVCFFVFCINSAPQVDISRIIIQYFAELSKELVRPSRAMIEDPHRPNSNFVFVIFFIPRKNFLEQGPRILMQLGFRSKQERNKCTEPAAG